MYIMLIIMHVHVHVCVHIHRHQMLFYESARCLHGRMSRLRGKYYASVFVHYQVYSPCFVRDHDDDDGGVWWLTMHQPVSRSIWPYEHDDIIEAVPPHWNEGALHIPDAPIAGAVRQ